MSFFIKKQSDRFKSKKFLAFVRTCPCCICGNLRTVTPSHMFSVRFQEGSDALAVPACLENNHHPQSTRTARELVFAHCGDLPKLHSKYYRMFLQEHFVTPVPEFITQQEMEFMLREMGYTQ